MFRVLKRTVSLGTQKNRLNKTVLFSTQIIMLKLMGKKIFTIYAAFFLCLSKPVKNLLVLAFVCLI